MKGLFIHSHQGADQPHTHDRHQHRPEGTTEPMQFREEQLQARTEQVETGRVQLAKHVVEEKRTLQVPVAHEDVVIERRPVERTPSESPAGASNAPIRVPCVKSRCLLRSGQWSWKRSGSASGVVQGTQQVSGTVPREEARVETEGEAHPHREAWRTRARSTPRKNRLEASALVSPDTIRIRATDASPVRAAARTIEERPVRRSAVDSYAIEPFTAAATWQRLHWSAIWAGLLGALATLFFLSLLGAAVGLTGMNAATAAAQGGPPADAGRNSAIWEGFSALCAFLVGGYLASRIANLADGNWSALHGAMVFLLGLPILLWLAGQGLGAVLGTFSSIAGGFSASGQAAANSAQDAAQQAGSAARANPTAVGEAAAALRNGAWATLIGSLLGLGASTLGGMLGADELRRLTRRDRREYRRVIDQERRHG